MTHHNFQKTVSSPLRPLPWPHRTLQTCSWDLSRLILPNHEIHWSSLKSLILKPQFDGQPGFRLRPHPATAATVLKKTQKLGLRFQTVAPDVLNLALENSNMISQMVYNGLQWFTNRTVCTWSKMTWSSLQGSLQMSSVAWWLYQASQIKCIANMSSWQSSCGWLFPQYWRCTVALRLDWLTTYLL